MKFSVREGDKVLFDQRYYMTDLGIAAQTVMLAARDLGLGTVFVGIFERACHAAFRRVAVDPLGWKSFLRSQCKRWGPLFHRFQKLHVASK